MTTAEALDRLTVIIEADPLCNAWLAMRNLLILDGDTPTDDDRLDCDPATFAELVTLTDIIRRDREAFTRLALEVSLCPLHLCDYASCFDDDEPECAVIRIIHPEHDT